MAPTFPEAPSRSELGRQARQEIQEWCPHTALDWRAAPQVSTSVSFTSKWNYFVFHSSIPVQGLDWFILLQHASWILELWVILIVITVANYSWLSRNVIAIAYQWEWLSWSTYSDQINTVAEVLLCCGWSSCWINGNMAFFIFIFRLSLWVYCEHKFSRSWRSGSDNRRPV